MSLINKYMDSDSGNSTREESNSKYQQLVELFSDKTDISLDDYFGENQMGDIEDSGDLIEKLREENALEVEIIYYANAIEYLAREDASLSDSIEIAVEYGYELENVNSELLASLLATQKNEEQVYNISDDIDEILNAPSRMGEFDKEG